MADKDTGKSIRVYIGNIEEISSRPDAYDKYYKELSEYRRSRADRVRPENDKIRAVGAGILLKIALKEYGLNENELEYCFGDNGKPFIKDHPEVFFSLSHSGDRVMCVTARFMIGCDTERVRIRTKTNLKVAGRFFTEDENELLRAAELKSEEEFNKLFYKIWTLKESYIKYTGEGLRCPMDSFSIAEKKKKDVCFETIESEPEKYRYALCFGAENKNSKIETEWVRL